MHTYNLDDPSFFLHDLEEIFDRIGELYTIDFKARPFFFQTKMDIDKSVHWASPQSAESFNKRIPLIKSLVKDMYAIIESLYVSVHGKFGSEEKQELELKYANLKEFRLLNNKLKHFKSNSVEIALISVNFIDDSLMDLMIQYKRESNIELVNFGDLIRTFFLILEDFEAISIDKTS